MASQSKDRGVRGLLGEKLGMTQIFDASNRMIPVTVVKAGPCVVTQIRTQEKDGYSAIQIGYGQIDPRKVTKPVAGHFAAAGVTPRRHLIELRTNSTDGFEVGQEFGADLFAAGASVDVTGTTKGKGTAGVMKRHGFAGVSSSHGSHRNHRKPGSIGGCSTPGRVFKGMRMSGRMGVDKQTTQSLRIVKVDIERGLLLIEGAVPGPKGGLVLVRSSVKGSAGTEKGA
jgi:large subunit ribosomal protein L3